MVLVQFDIRKLFLVEDSAFCHSEYPMIVFRNYYTIPTLVSRWVRQRLTEIRTYFASSTRISLFIHTDPAFIKDILNLVDILTARSTFPHVSLRFRSINLCHYPTNIPSFYITIPLCYVCIIYLYQVSNNCLIVFA